MLKKLVQYLAAELKAEFFRLLEEELAKVGLETSAPAPAAAPDTNPPAEG